MNTLIQFIDFQLSLTEPTTTNSMKEINEGQETSTNAGNGQYEVIENESFTGNYFNNLALSGSLFSLTTFTDVLFESCAFYASKMENCTFINVKFENCTFEFTKMQYCNFNTCTFENCSFQISSIAQSDFAHCTYEGIVDYIIHQGHKNREFNCTKPEILTWEEVLSPPSMEQSSHTIGEKNEKTASLKIEIMGIIDEIFKSKKAA